MKPFGILILVLLLASCGRKVDVVPVSGEVKEGRFLLNGVEVSEGWKLASALDAMGGRGRQIDLHQSSYFIYDSVGVVVFEAESIFEKTPRGYLNGVNFFFDTNPENKDYPKQVLKGDLVINGIHIGPDFNKQDLRQFLPDVAPNSEIYKYITGKCKVYFDFYDGEDGRLENVQVAPASREMMLTPSQCRLADRT
jgi:hypothetical protein